MKIILMAVIDFCKKKKKLKNVLSDQHNPQTYMFLFLCRYETSDGQSREETGYFHHDPKLGKILQVRGSYGYTGKERIFFILIMSFK